MQKNRELRYPTVLNLAEDVQHYLRNEPVSAGPPGSTGQLKKMAGQKPRCSEHGGGSGCVIDWRHSRHLVGGAAAGGPAPDAGGA